MADFWDYFKNLFNRSTVPGKSNPMIHELIERSEEEREDYIAWKESLIKRRLLDWLIDQYGLYQALPDEIDEAIDFLNTPSTKGFVVHFHETNYPKREVVHLFDYLKERVLALEYKTQISDRKLFSRDFGTEMFERHYLKPRKKIQEGQQFDQAYGNVTIELVMRKDKPHLLKFSTTIYKDSQFKEALPFQELMNQVLVN